MQDKRNIENVVKEIMGLVSTHAQMHRASFMGSAKENSEYRSEVDKTRIKIESKLREMVENSFSVLEPFSGKLPKGFLADVVTAAGLVEHGKQSKALGERLASAVMQIRASNFAKDS